MTTTRAKFYVTGLELLPGLNAGINLKLSAVARGDRNAGWATATPCGTMTMTINNPEAVKWWEDFMQASRTTGKNPELFIDIFPSEDGWPGDGHAFRMSDLYTDPAVYYYGKCAECGMDKDADVTEYDPVLQKHVPVGKAHPNG